MDDLHQDGIHRSRTNPFPDIQCRMAPGSVAIDLPMGAAILPGETFLAPRSWAEKSPRRISSMTDKVHPPCDKELGQLEQGRTDTTDRMVERTLSLFALSATGACATA